VRWRGLYQTLAILGWCLTTVRSEEKEAEKEAPKECNNISYTDQKRQQEENLTDCPDNQAFFFVVAAAFVGGLVVSYVVLQFIIKCSQIGAPKAKAKGKADDKKKEEKKPKEEAKEKTKEVATSSTGANGGVATKP